MKDWNHFIGMLGWMALAVFCAVEERASWVVIFAAFWSGCACAYWVKANAEDTASTRRTRLSNERPDRHSP